MTQPFLDLAEKKELLPLMELRALPLLFLALADLKALTEPLLDLTEKKELLPLMPLREFSPLTLPLLGLNV